MRNFLSNLVRRRLSPRVYNLLIGAILMYGFIINALMCIYLTDLFMSWNVYAIIIGYFVIALWGINLSISNDNAFISFIGYNMVVLPVGVVLSIFVKLLELESYEVLNTIYVTAGVTLFMIFFAIINPELFENLGGILSMVLGGIIIIEFIMIVLNNAPPSKWDFGVAFVFCLYIGYNWSIAQSLPKTADSAVDICVCLYLNIINLFMRLLSAESSSKSSKR